MSDYASILSDVWTVLTGAPIDRVEAGGSSGVTGLETAGVFDPVRAFSVGIAVDLVTKLHKSALEDLDAALDNAGSILNGQVALEGGGFQPLGPDAQSGGDDLLAALTAAEHAADAVASARSSESQQAMQSAADERARQREALRIEEEERQRQATATQLSSHDQELRASPSAEDFSGLSPPCSDLVILQNNTFHCIGDNIYECTDGLLPAIANFTENFQHELIGQCQRMGYLR